MKRLALAVATAALALVGLAGPVAAHSVTGVTVVVNCDGSYDAKVSYTDFSDNHRLLVDLYYDGDSSPTRINQSVPIGTGTRDLTRPAGTIKESIRVVGLTPDDPENGPVEADASIPEDCGTVSPPPSSSPSPTPTPTPTATPTLTPPPVCGIQGGSGAGLCTPPVTATIGGDRPSGSGSSLPELLGLLGAIAFVLLIGVLRPQRRR